VNQKKNVNTPGAFVYQGGSLVVPIDTPDSLFYKETSRELIDAAFTGVADSFVVPALDGKGDIGGVIIPDGELPEGWKAVPLRQALLAVRGGIMAEGHGPEGRMLRSFHVSTWRTESRFCGSCGAANRDSESEAMARQCPICGRLEFPRISPAVIIIVTNDNDEVLLAHNKKFTSSIYSVIAGFTEPGESLEETVSREIKEEVNIDVKDIRYIRSQPWPFPNSLMFGFSARYSGGELRPDGIEIEDVSWFSRENLPALPGSASISRYLINLWLEGKLGNKQ